MVWPLPWNQCSPDECSCPRGRRWGPVLTDSRLPLGVTNEKLRTHLLAVWVNLAVGLDSHGVPIALRKPSVCSRRRKSRPRANTSTQHKQDQPWAAPVANWKVETGKDSLDEPAIRVWGILWCIKTSRRPDRKRSQEGLDLEAEQVLKPSSKVLGQFRLKVKTVTCGNGRTHFSWFLSCCQPCVDLCFRDLI